MLRDGMGMPYPLYLRVLVPLRRRGEEAKRTFKRETAGQMWRVLMGVNHGYVAAN